MDNALPVEINFDTQQFKRFIREVQLTTHPDKVSEQMKTKATEIYKILQTSKGDLLKAGPRNAVKTQAL